MNYFEHSLLFIYALVGCVSISAFTSLTDVPIGILYSALELKICAITARIKKYQLLRKKRKNQDKLAKTKSNLIEVLISKSLIDAYICHDEFILVNLLKKYNEIKEEIKQIKTST